MSDYFYIDQLIKYIVKNIDKIPNTNWSLSDDIVKNFVNGCCSIVKQYDIQIFLAPLTLPLSINKELQSSSFVELVNANVFKNLKISDDVNKIQYCYKQIKNILNKVQICEKLLYISFHEKTKYTNYLYENIKKYELQNTRIISHYMCPLYNMPKDTHTTIKIILFNQDLNVTNNNITFLNIKKIIMTKDIWENKKEFLINKLGQIYIKYLLQKISIVEESNIVNCVGINVIKLNFNHLIDELSTSINKCIMCNIYDKHFENFKYIDYYYTKCGYYCKYCENVFNKDNLILFIMNNIIKW